MDELAPLMAEFRDIQARAEAAGVFLGDRELLLCPDCGLTEDVLAHGGLITYRGDPPGEDTGLRFVELDVEGRFRCPSCGAEVELPNSPEDNVE
jgi:predicted RNA-binding Zn-ribbon protein involved in translation (DUF1610 family)